MPLLKMNDRIRKIILAVLLIPSSVFWLVISLIGISFYRVMMFESIEYFVLTLASLLGVFCCLVAIYAVFTFPRVNKFLAYSAVVGLLTLTVALAIGVFGKVFVTPWFFVAALFLFGGTFLLTKEYFRGT